ncbi:hypothetical protein O181_047108 [Austropuccinia psidii MF-1]|uniref:Uncharacterized protein n=1 Tax=Austropuccinia psidii MF-1 TaxID=1389203 RepID=A0A9Q3DTJ3_9BASI|nr:hypothetical protein [Austropuccinia psidii MF-1]
MESQQEVQTPGEKRSQDKGESGHYQSHRVKTEPARSCSVPFRVIRSKPSKLPISFIAFRHQYIIDQESPFVKIPGNFHDKTRIKREKQDSFQQEEERVRPHDPEEVALDERSTPEPEIALSTSDRIRSPSHGRISPTKNGQSVVTPESNINSNELWLQMSQF